MNEEEDLCAACGRIERGHTSPCAQFIVTDDLHLFVEPGGDVVLKRAEAESWVVESSLPPLDWKTAAQFGAALLQASTMANLRGTWVKKEESPDA